MYNVVLARGPLQSHFEDVAFLVHGFSVLISFAGVERHWFVTQSASCELGCIRHKLRTDLLEASNFQF
jgi:hypothetical protein